MVERDDKEMTDKEIDNIDWGEDEKWSFYSQGLPESARDSGYKNAAYALGELVDNSIQAGAHDVEIIMFERFGGAGKRQMWNVQQIGILDNGCGMDPLLQRLSIKYQSGSTQMGIERGSSDKQMGKFGVGLPQASISQARRLEVYTWTSAGPSNATFTYIDFDEPNTFRNVPDSGTSKPFSCSMSCTRLGSSTASAKHSSEKIGHRWKIRTKLKPLCACAASNVWCMCTGFQSTVCATNEQFVIDRVVVDGFRGGSGVPLGCVLVDCPMLLVGEL